MRTVWLLPDLNTQVRGIAAYLESKWGRRTGRYDLAGSISIHVYLATRPKLVCIRPMPPYSALEESLGTPRWSQLASGRIVNPRARGRSAASPLAMRRSYPIDQVTDDSRR